MLGTWELVETLSLVINDHPLPTTTLTFEQSESESQGLTPLGGAVDPKTDLVGSGRFRWNQTDGEFSLTASQGESRLEFTLSGIQEPRVSLVALIEAPNPKRDLLFLTDETSGQVLAFRRASASTFAELSWLSRSLLQVALHGSDFADAAQARDFLAQRSDWQSAVSLLMTELDEDPNAPHNNRCLTLHTLIEAHPKDVEVSLATLLATLESKSWTNQQKCGWVVATLADRKDLFLGSMDQALATLIRRLASQRQRVVGPALTALGKLTGQSFGRQPEAWRDWYREETGRSLALTGAVQETLVVIRLQSAEDSEGSPTFVIEDETFSSSSEVTNRVRTLRDRSPVPVSVIVQVEPSSIGRDSTLPADAVPLVEELQLLAFPITLAPTSDTFYPPYPAAWPE